MKDGVAGAMARSFETVFGVLVLTIGCARAAFAQDEVYEYRLHGGGERQTMTLSSEPERTTAVFCDERGEKQVITFDERDRMQHVERYRTDGTLALQVSYDYDASKIKVEDGGQTREFSLDGLVVDNNAGMFYLFSRLRPRGDEELRFRLLQSREGRTVKMYLKRIGKEPVATPEGIVEAEVFEMGLKGLARWFWPYKYRYWYKADGHELLRYEGVNGSKRLQVSELVRASKPM